MGDNVQCPVCTLYLLPGMDLSDHLETHPKEQVIKALVQLSLKSESTEIVTPDTPKKAKNVSSFVESSSVSRQATEDERTTPLSEISGSGSGSSGASVTIGIHDKRREIDENSGLAPLSQNGLNRQCGYLIENNSSSSSSSSSNFFGPPTPYYRHHSHHNTHQQQHNQQQQQQQQSQLHYHPYQSHPHGGGSSTMGIGPTQPPLRLFSYQAQPKPLQPPPAYGTAISQLRSQNSQNLNLTNVNRSLLHTSYTPTSSSSLSSSSSVSPSAMTQSRLLPPLPPPPLSQRYAPNFPHVDTSFNDSCESSAMSPRRSSMTPPTRPPPQLYRSPLSSNGQYSRQSSSPYSVMTGSPSVLRFAESPVTAQYLERENGDFIVQETPKHVVECVEKDDGEFSVIERVYHMPPSVVQINEDQDDDMSDQGSNSDDMKTLEDDRPNGTWSASRSPEHSLAGQQRQQKKSGITVLSDVQLDINEYLDLMGNIIALSKAAKTRTEMIKIEKIDPEDPDEVKEELRGSICLDENEENNSPVIDQKQDEITTGDHQDSSDKSTCRMASPSPFAATSSAESLVVPGTTSVIRLAANSTIVSNTTTTTATTVDDTPEPVSPPDAPVTKVEEAVQTTNVEMEITKVEEAVQTTIAGVSVSTIEEGTNTPTETKTEDELSQTCPETQPSEQEKEKEPPTTTALDTLLASTEPHTSASSQAQPDGNLEKEQTLTSPSTQAAATQDPEEVLTPTCTKSLAMDPPTEPTQPTDPPAQTELLISHIEHSVKFEITEIIEKPEQEETEPEKQPDKPQKLEKQMKKQENPPIVSYHHQTVKRPIKKVPKKLVIKPKSKNSTVTTPASHPRVQTPTPKSTATATATAIATQLLAPSTSTEAIALEPEKVEVMSEAEVSQEEMRTIKMETLPIMALEPIPPPLFADADEKLPPDDDVQPSTSSLITADHEDAMPAINPSKEKPTADLAAFLDECMKKEVVEEHPMHSIFGMEIEETGETLDNPLSPPIASGFPSALLFSKPLLNSEHLSISESVLPDSNDLQDPDNQPQQQQQQSNSAYVEYPYSFLYGADANHQEDHKHNGSPPMYCSENFNKYSASTSCGNSASCTWNQSQSSENDFEIDGKGSYLDLDSCKRSASFAAATEASMPTTDTLNIRTDEKMPAKGEISEQESNCGLENSWSQPPYNARFSHPYHNIMALNESWSHDYSFRPQDLSSSIETKNFSLRLTEESPIMDILPSTSKRKNKAIAKVPRKKTFQCTHCSTHFPLLKEKNAHLIKQHGYKRVNRRLVRDPPTSTVTTATMNTIDAGASLLLGLEHCALPPPALAEEEDSKAAIVKIEQENQEQKDCKKNITNLTLTSPVQPTSASISRTKYDSMRARDNRMLINFNLNALNVKNEGEAHSHYMESKSSFCCFVCKRDFLTVKLYDEHLNEHPAECFTCHKKFTRWKNFMVHLKRHLGWKDFGCTFCEKKFVIRSALVEHMRMHTGQTPLKCKICGKSFKRYSNLTQHRKRHGTKINRSKEYVCFCGEVLPSKARFIWHKETHDLKPKCCPYCRDRFVHANSLRRHIRLAHSDKFDYTEPMECPMCKQIYAKSSIKAHMATHTIDTQHECLICNKSFSTKWNLKIHNWVHANRTTKPYKCDQCVKAFVREVDYNNHMNSHKQIKPYTCEHCGCKFIRKYNYIRHRREHHGNKKFTCDLCGKLFHRHYYLIEHRRIHTGERPFQCTICGKSSTTKTNHNKHLKIHHSRDPFTSEA